MSFVPKDYADAAQAVIQITAQTSSLTRRLTTLKQRVTDARVELEAMDELSPVGWLDAVQFIDAKAAAAPGDDDWQNLKSVKGKLVSDVQAGLTRALAIEAAISGL